MMDSHLVSLTNDVNLSVHLQIPMIPYPTPAVDVQDHIVQLVLQLSVHNVFQTNIL